MERWVGALSARPGTTAARRYCKHSCRSPAAAAVLPRPPASLHLLLRSPTATPPLVPQVAGLTRPGCQAGACGRHLLVRTAGPAGVGSRRGCCRGGPRRSCSDRAGSSGASCSMPDVQPCRSRRQHRFRRQRTCSTWRQGAGRTANAFDAAAGRLSSLAPNADRSAPVWQPCHFPGNPHGCPNYVDPCTQLLVHCTLCSMVEQGSP